MLTEMLGKGGQVCQHAKEGQIRCPLIVRPTSEDVITGNLFQVLRALNPRWWLPGLLNEGLGAVRFRQQVYRRLDCRLWQNRSPYRVQPGFKFPGLDVDTKSNQRLGQTSQLADLEPLVCRLLSDGEAFQTSLTRLLNQLRLSFPRNS